MGKQRASIIPRSPYKHGSDDGNAIPRCKELSEQEQLFEVESVGEEESCRKEPNKEDKSSEQSPDEEGKEEELNENKRIEEPDKESNEEDSSEGTKAQPFVDSDDVENHTPTVSSSEKKRRLTNTLDDHAQKRLKQDSTSEPYSGKNLFNSEISLNNHEKSGSSGKRRRSKLNSEAEGDGEADDGGDGSNKKRKTVLISDDPQLKLLGPLKLPDFPKGLASDTDSDPQIQTLNSQLCEINQKLKAPEVTDDRPEDKRSPSPPPIYNNLGIRVNTREIRLRKKLTDLRQQIISNLVQQNPLFKAPSEYKPSKFYSKLYIPVKEYPGYNFIGLIIGPRGHTQKRMEKETGARILLRGKGSSKLGKAQLRKDAKTDFTESEDLHVYIEADNQKSLDAAVKMVEKLLVPVEEKKNEHKQAQLRELAELHSSREENSSELPMISSNISPPCHNDANNYTAASPSKDLISGTGTNGCFHFGGPTVPRPALPWMGNATVDATVLSFSGKPMKEFDESKLFVGYLPQSVNDDKLRELFSPFGGLCEAIVIKDKITGLSKGYGFVKYTDPVSAAKAVARMNGFSIDGKSLAVRIAGRPPFTAIGPRAAPCFVRRVIYPGPRVITKGNFGVFPSAFPQGKNGMMDWPGLPGSILTEPYVYLPKSNWFPLHTTTQHGKPHPCFGPSVQAPATSAVNSGCIPSSGDFLRFPGYSQHHLPQLAPFSGLPPFQGFIGSQIIH